jgi:hypothetical protein
MLAIAAPDADGDWPKPKTRLRLGPHQIFTFEFDEESPEFFIEQLGWCEACPPFRTSALAILHERMREFADYELATVVWSGAKSLHIHLTFSTQLFVNTHGQPCPTTIQYGHQAHWEILRSIVMDVLRPSGGVQPDHNLSRATSFRRTPRALRTLDKPNVLGFSAGKRVRQVVLWEQESKRHSSVKLLLSPSLFTVSNDRLTPRACSSGMALPADQHRHCQRRLADFYDGTGLDFVRLVHAGDGHRVLFRNSARDRNPSTYIGDGFVTPSVPRQHLWPRFEVVI